MRECLKAEIIRTFECGAHLWSYTAPGGATRKMTVINKGGHCMIRVQTQASVPSFVLVIIRRF